MCTEIGEKNVYINVYFQGMIKNTFFELNAGEMRVFSAV